VLRGSREGGKLQSALREKDCSRIGPESIDDLVDCSDLNPAIACLACPGRTGEDDERHTRRQTRGHRAGGHARSKRVRRVDHGVDALAGEKRSQAFGAAKAADASGDRRWSGIGGRSRQRQDCRNIRLIGDPPSERAGLRRAAEDEQAKTLQGAAP
jgi:hypothetical protein